MVLQAGFENWIKDLEFYFVPDDLCLCGSSRLVTIWWQHGGMISGISEHYCVTFNVGPISLLGVLRWWSCMNIDEVSFLIDVSPGRVCCGVK